MKIRRNMTPEEQAKADAEREKIRAEMEVIPVVLRSGEVRNFRIGTDSDAEMLHKEYEGKWTEMMPIGPVLPEEPAGLQVPAPAPVQMAQAATVDLTEEALAVYDPEARRGVNLGEVINLEALSEKEQLEVHKETIVKYLKYGDAIMFSIAGELDQIRERELYKHDENPATGKPFHSMNEYMPYLLEELKTRARLHKLSRRQVYEYLALRRVFVEKLGLSVSEIMEIGPSHFTEIREALDYDRKTGEIAKEPRAGKISAETALKMVEELREAAQAGVEVRVQDTTKALDAERGVQRRSVELDWVRNPDGRTYYLSRVKLWWEDDTYVEPMNRVTEEQARWVTKRWGAMSNLPPEE